MRIDPPAWPRPRRRRQLTADERELWRAATRATTPLRPAIEPASADAGERSSVDALAARPSSRLRGLEPKGKLSPFDPRLKRRLSRGVIKIDASLDLHGLTQTGAHAALSSFLVRARAAGARVVLVITGKGEWRGAQTEAGPGVLRRQVPLWLKSPLLRDHVTAFAPAHVGHGGAGALYIQLRRPAEGAEANPAVPGKRPPIKG